VFFGVVAGEAIALKQAHGIGFGLVFGLAKIAEDAPKNDQSARAPQRVTCSGCWENHRFSLGRKYWLASQHECFE
jgi:hypothetical protein